MGDGSGAVAVAAGGWLVSSLLSSGELVNVGKGLNTAVLVNSTGLSTTASLPSGKSAQDDKSIEKITTRRAYLRIRMRIIAVRICLPALP